MRVLLIGLGRWGEKHLRVLGELGVELWVADVSAERRAFAVSGWLGVVGVAACILVTNYALRHGPSWAWVPIAVGVIIADSRTHAMRLGCSGVAIGCAGIPSVIDDRGRSDLFGRKLEVTKRAVADNIASAAEIVMGEADECTPAAVIRGIGLPVGDLSGVESIAADECLFMGVFAKSRR